MEIDQIEKEPRHQDANQMEREPRHQDSNPKEPNRHHRDRHYHSRKNRRDARTEKEPRHKEREGSHRCESERKGRSRDHHDQFKSNRKNPRIQDDFTIKEIDQQLGKERFDQKGRDPSYGDESKREIEGYQTTIEGGGRDYQAQSSRDRNIPRNQYQCTIQGSDHFGKDPIIIDQRPKVGREPRDSNRVEPRDGSNRKRKRSISRSNDKKMNRTEIEEIKKGEITMGKAAKKDFSLRPHLKPDKNQMRSRNQEVVWRNWLDLPRDVMHLILSKVGIVDILRTAPLVCSNWHHLAKDPILFRSVVLSESVLSGAGGNERQIIRKAAHMSCGGLVEFWCSSMITVFFKDLQHLVPSAHSIKSLRLGTLIHFQISTLVQIVKCMSSLEDIYLSDYIWPKGVLDVIGTSCPNLKSASFGTFCLSGHGAFSIANTMPRLRRLYLRGCFLTMEALQAILDGCRYLEYLHVEGLSNVTNLEGKYARNYQCKSYFKEHLHGSQTERIWELELKRNDDRRPSLVGSSNGYELSSLPFPISIDDDVPLVWVKRDQEES